MGERGASAGDPAGPGAAESSQAPVAPEAGTSPAASSASAPAEPTPKTPTPEQTAIPTTVPGTSAAGGETAPGGDTTPGGGTRPASPAAAPRGPENPTSTSQVINRDKPVANVTLGEALTVTVLGLPSKVAPGSGWHNFTVRVANTSDKAITSIWVRFDMNLNAWSNGDDTRRLLTVRWYDEDAGLWKEMIDDDSYHYEARFTDLAPGEYVDTKLRLKADASMPDSFGGGTTVGGFYDENGVTHSGVLSGYWFETVAADSELGRVPPAKGKPAGGNKPAPQGDLKELPTTGKPTATSTGTGTGKPAATGAGGGEARPVAGRPGGDDHSADRAGSGATLAETGSDAASGWMLGAGGASIALGTALAAAACRRHRHTS